MFTTIDPVTGTVRPDGEPLKTLRRSALLTLYGHIKTAEQLTIIQQYGDWYTGR